MLRLHPEKPGERLPVHYNEYLQALIYTHLDQHLARALHEEGIPEGLRRLKLFTFSRLLGPCRVEGGWLEPKGTLRLVVASPMVPFLESFALHLVTNSILRLGPARFAVEAVEVEFQQPYQNPVLLRALSPVVVYSTLFTPDGRKKTYYYAPPEDEFERLVLSNLRRKVRAWTGEDIPEEAASFRPARVSARNQHIVLYKGTVIKGWSGVYELRAPEPYFRMALDAGLGSKNSQGFGCVEVWRPRSSGAPGYPHAIREKGVVQAKLSQEAYYE
ncbi:MAG: CRISPR-associated endoribonuclease Cas6 [Armatimonadetes bacterium]|nr:CRISPR-associated endoribonuclease Cas6 [Armatimonadota bacterium]MDW8154298.1 CRISPR-associated endoribonuclease Cas6 [Armatimonadota bacterium]